MQGVALLLVLPCSEGPAQSLQWGKLRHCAYSMRFRQLTGTCGCSGTGGPAAAPRAGLSWANQVRALPPAYQEIGAQIVSQTLGPSADIPAAANSESVTAVPEPVEDPAAAPAAAPAATDPTAAAAAPVTDPAAASTVPEATVAPTPVPTPQPTFAPTRTPAAEAGPVATALPALVPVEAPALVRSLVLTLVCSVSA